MVDYKEKLIIAVQDFPALKWLADEIPPIYAGVKKCRVPEIERPSAHRTLCQIVRYAPMFFVKVTLYSVDVYGKRTLSYGGLPIFLHRFLKMCRAYSLRTLVRLFLCRNRRNIKTARIMILCVATATSLPLGAGAILFFFFLLQLDTDMTPRPNVLFWWVVNANL